ncbi:hypothetical protein BV25DRAFT_1867919 [Artomyces pyxidatus]|uniref:Uncharacterized protein n=1 Tax=Artomyces pyxidatus TaxID=48021 RepID=A0ACB8TGK0_9AGAM|nr:hypothetical protein BV25DRAFT_1867919 [Artomyces pyxidatus]
MLKPLVDDLLRLWKPGVYLSQTASYPLGRLVRCALIPLVCDLPALRKVAGYMGHGGRFPCSFCRISNEHAHSNFDYSSWDRHSWGEHLATAIRWRDAASEKEQQDLFEEHGIRWSELLRLPYWDVTKYSVLDSMHNLFLGDFKRHCKNIWHMTSDLEADTPETDVPNPKKKSVVLDKNILKEVWRDIAQTYLPSWLGRPPKRFGATGGGRIKADHWRTGCLVSLPITLIRLWGQPHSSPEEKQLLENFLHLVVAVKWATKRTTSRRVRDIVQSEYHRYCTSLVQLFGPDVVMPNNHLTFHLVECLELFGPVRGWWAFPFERYNGIIQRFSTNGRLGECSWEELHDRC